MKKSLRRKIQRSVSVITTIACLAANTFVYAPGAAAQGPDTGVSDIVSENEEILGNNGINPAEGNSGEDADGASGSEGKGGSAESGVSEELNMKGETAPGAEDENSSHEALSEDVGQDPEGESVDFTYEIADGNVTIKGYKGTSPKLVIPDTIEDHPVTAIGNSAFIGNTVITSVSIPETVESIGNYAFSNCNSLGGGV